MTSGSVDEKPERYTRQRREREKAQSPADRGDIRATNHQRCRNAEVEQVPKKAENGENPARQRAKRRVRPPFLSQEPVETISGGCTWLPGDPGILRRSFRLEIPAAARGS